VLSRHTGYDAITNPFSCSLHPVLAVPLRWLLQVLGIVLSLLFYWLSVRIAGVWDVLIPGGDVRLARSKHWALSHGRPGERLNGASFYPEPSWCR
jgi:hypothetical protein